MDVNGINGPRNRQVGTGVAFPGIKPSIGRRIVRVRRWGLALLVTFVAALAVGVLAVFGPGYAYLPHQSKVLNPEAFERAPAYDLWGRRVAHEEAPNIDAKLLSPAAGAVRVDDATLTLGRAVFYQETFGNEVFLTDVMGLVDGPLPIWQYAKAILALRGQATTNLRVAIAYDTVVGGRAFRQGELIDTGLDVPVGVLLPLGMKIKFDNGRLKAGLTCAACHSTVDAASGMVIHGAVNTDLNAGVLMALASNSAAYFPHATRVALDAALQAATVSVPGSHGAPVALPDAHVLEDAVDRVLLQWPPGHFDSTIDLTANPTDMPDSFTLDDHPYGYSGFASVGPFRGLATFSSNVHAQNADTLAHAVASPVLFDLDAEAYVGAILQRAATPKYRYDPASGLKPTAFFAAVDPTPDAPGINEIALPPTWPRITYVAPDGVTVGSPGRYFYEQVNAVAAWQNTLEPPDPARSAQRPDEGRALFERAGCRGCHDGPAYTNNRVIAAEEIASEPTRAVSFKRREALFAPPQLYAFDTPLPLPKNPRPISVPVAGFPEDRFNAWAHGPSRGGYKVPSLLGLARSAPYLHDGGVAVAADPSAVGVRATRGRGVAADPVNSLRALLDRSLRAQVIAANTVDASLGAMNIRGVGHAFWVDGEAGYRAEEQLALIDFLLALRYDPDSPRAPTASDGTRPPQQPATPPAEPPPDK
jgi:hypothetical protein